MNYENHEILTAKDLFEILEKNSPNDLMNFKTVDDYILLKKNQQDEFFYLLSQLDNKELLTTVSQLFFHKDYIYGDSKSLKSQKYPPYYNSDLAQGSLPILESIFFIRDITLTELIETETLHIITSINEYIYYVNFDEHTEYIPYYIKYINNQMYTYPYRWLRTRPFYPESTKAIVAGVKETIDLARFYGNYETELKIYNKILESDYNELIKIPNIKTNSNYDMSECFVEEEAVNYYLENNWLNKSLFDIQQYDNKSLQVKVKTRGYLPTGLLFKSIKENMKGNYHLIPQIYNTNNKKLLELVPKSLGIKYTESEQMVLNEEEFRDLAAYRVSADHKNAAYSLLMRKIFIPIGSFERLEFSVKLVKAIIESGLYNDDEIAQIIAKTFKFSNQNRYGGERNTIELLRSIHDLLPQEVYDNVYELAVDNFYTFELHGGGRTNRVYIPKESLISEEKAKEMGLIFLDKESLAIIESSLSY